MYTKILVVFFTKRRKKSPKCLHYTLLSGIYNIIYTILHYSQNLKRPLAYFNHCMVPISSMFSFVTLLFFSQVVIPISCILFYFVFFFFRHVLTSIFGIFSSFVLFFFWQDVISLLLVYLVYLCSFCSILWI